MLTDFDNQVDRTQGKLATTLNKLNKLLVSVKGMH